MLRRRRLALSDTEALAEVADSLVHAGAPAGPLGRPGLGVAGNVQDITLVSPAERLAVLLRLVGDDKAATTVSITGTAQLINPVAADFVSDAFLDVQFGTGGARHRVRVDLGPRGTTLVVPAGTVEVQGGGVGSGLLRIQANAAYSGARPPVPPMRTLQAAAIAAAGTAALVVPALASLVRFARTPNTEAFQYQFRRQNLTAIADGIVGAGVGEAIARVPPDAQDVLITNLGVAALAQFRAIFEVLL